MKKIEVLQSRLEKIKAAIKDREKRIEQYKSEMSAETTAKIDRHFEIIDRQIEELQADIEEMMIPEVKMFALAYSKSIYFKDIANAVIKEAFGLMTETEERTIDLWIDGCTLEMIAERECVTRERVRQRINHATTKVVKKLIDNRQQTMKVAEAEDIENFRLGDLRSQTPIGNIGLSARALNCVARNKIDTLGDIILPLISGDIKKWRNMGKKTYFEVVRCVMPLVPAEIRKAIGGWNEQ